MWDGRVSAHPGRRVLAHTRHGWALACTRLGTTAVQLGVERGARLQSAHEHPAGPGLLRKPDPRSGLEALSLHSVCWPLLPAGSRSQRDIGGSMSCS